VCNLTHSAPLNILHRKGWFLEVLTTLHKGMSAPVLTHSLRYSFLKKIVGSVFCVSIFGVPSENFGRQFLFIDFQFLKFFNLVAKLWTTTKSRDCKHVLFEAVEPLGMGWWCYWILLTFFFILIKICHFLFHPFSFFYVICQA
jgi:hypothetical protein